MTKLDIFLIVFAIIVPAITFIVSYYRNQRYTNLLRSFLTPLCILNKEGRIIDILNIKYASESPFNMGQSKNKDFASMIDNEEERKVFINGLTDVIDGKRFKMDEKFAVKSIAGKRVVMLFHIIKYQNNVLVQMNDITEEFESVKEQSKMLGLILDKMGIPVFIRDIRNNFSWKFWNTKLEDLFGIDRKKLIGRNNVNFIESDMVESIDVDSINVADGKDSEGVLINPVCGDKKEHFLNVYQERVDCDSYHWIVGTIKDITQSVKQKKSIDIVNRQYQFISKAVHVNMWIWDLKSDTVTISPNDKYYPEDSGIILSKSEVFSHIKDEDCSRFISVTDGVISGNEESFNIEYEYRLSSGKFVWMESIGSIGERDADGNALTIIGTTINIDTRKRLEEDLIMSKKINTKDNQTKSNLLTKINYVINTPLNSIIGYSQLLEDENDPNVRKEYVRNLQRDSAQLLNMINVMLQISNIQAGIATFIKQPIDLNGLIFDCYSTAVSQNLNNNVVIKNEIPAISTTLMMDNRYLMKVINNFISNAMKFTINGSITIGYSMIGHEKVYVYVKDTGCGITPEMKMKIFDRFSSKSKDMSYSPNQGLGLALCKAIIDRLGGEIGVNSELGKGSEFWFTLNIGY